MIFKPNNTLPLVESWITSELISLYDNIPTITDTTQLYFSLNDLTLETNNKIIKYEIILPTETKIVNYDPISAEKGNWNTDIGPFILNGLTGSVETYIRCTDLYGNIYGGKISLNLKYNNLYNIGNTIHEDFKILKKTYSDDNAIVIFNINSELKNKKTIVPAET